MGSHCLEQSKGEVALGMKGVKPFRPQVFLFRMLAAVFFTEALFLGFAYQKCSERIPGEPVPMVNERCPQLGARSTDLFQVAIATVLSLLGGAATTVASVDLGNRVKKEGSDSEPLE